jgi:chemotaxis protein histidine kinase CheA
LAESIETEALELASVPVRDMTTTLPQLVSYLAKKTGNDVRLEVEGEDLLIDRQVLDMLDDAVRQLVVNGVVHGIEDAETRLGVEKAATGVIRVNAEQEESNLKLVVTDDGRGIDWKMIKNKAIEKGLIDSDSDMAPDRMRSLLYHDGFSTLEEVGELAGDGMGMTLVRDAVEALNGSFRVESVPHKRTSVTITVPMHRAMQKALLVVSGQFTWGIPEVAVEEVIPMSAAAISVTDDATIIKWDDKDIPFASFSDVVGFTTSRLPTQVVVVSSSVGQVALAVEDVRGTRQVAAKELGALLAGSETVTGAALLGGDEIALLVDTASLTERQRRLAAEGPTFASPRILIVDDSLGVQQVVSSALATSGFMTSVAGSVADALGALQNEVFDALVVDFSMPRADGVALVHMVRQRHANTPIVMLSGVADEADIERAKQAGVDAFFDKSDFREGGLAEKLHELVAERREAEQTA